ncbi:MAG: hypothetical protein QM728_07910 [Gordonia sp. (in: high G+C Gram-positive bacteria)]|uniref:VOC family protein n=1 Tax=Gordonia sp. (in: high G+C Gram-positive bacteria) TaxID=84139 RepID=UPI0039E419AD
MTGPSAVVLLPVGAPERSCAAYARLLGAGTGDGAAHQWQVGTTRLVLCAGDSQPRLLVPAAELVGHGADGFAAAQKLLRRRSCAVDPVATVGGAPTAVAADLPVGLIDAAALDHVPAVDGDLVALDHVVMASGSRDRALALFAAVLGFDFRLEQKLDLPKLGTVHQLFLRGAGTIVEVLVDGPGDAPIGLWGLAWASGDLDATHARLAAAGVALSPIRSGNKRGTRVFTVRDDDLVVPTIVIGA